MKKCTKCGEEKDFELFYKRAASKDGLMTKCISCHNLYKKDNPEQARKSVDKYHKGNRDKILAKKAEYRRNNSGKISEYRKNYYKENKDKELDLRKTYQQANPDKCNAVQAKRRSNKLQATPRWVDLKAVELFYTLAKNKTKNEGLEYHVHHIIPLVSDTVCGLHWEKNLAVITAKENVEIGNRIWPDMP